MKTKATANRKNKSLIVEKVTVGVILAAFVLVGVNRAVAGPLYNEYGSPVAKATSDDIPKQTDKLVKKGSKRISKKMATKTKAKVKSSRSNNAFDASRNKTKAETIDKEILAESAGLAAVAGIGAKKVNARRAPLTKAQVNAQSKVSPQDPTKQNLVAANDSAAKKNLRFIRQQSPAVHQNIPTLYAMAPLDNKSILTHQEDETTSAGSNITKLEKPMPEKESVFSGSVNFTVGHDSNIDPNKEGTSGTFYQMTPTLSFKTDHWSGSFGADVKDFADQTTSNLNKTSEVSANVSYTGHLSEMTTSTTTLAGLYHDEMWPDYLTGLDVNQVDRGMPIRYTDGKLTEKLDFDFGNGFSTQVGGYYQHRENSNPYSDWAANILDPRLATQSFNEYSAFGKVGLAAGQYIELAARPSVTERDYTEREARQPDGSTGGWLLPAPLKKLLTTEVAFDLNFKYGKTVFGPTAMIGQVSDEALAGENASYYGGGVKGDIVLSEDYHITISPSVIYKEVAYDNWTYNTPGYTPTTAGEKRLDHHLDTAINGKIMFTKNFGWGLGYANANYYSNVNDTSENFKEEIISTTAIFSF